jgi:deoxyribonuclease V
MKLASLHDWDIDLKQAKALQAKLASRLLHIPYASSEARFVAGVDVSSNRGDKMIYAAIAVMDLQSVSVVDRAFYSMEQVFPYIPGYLSFREGPAVIGAWQKLCVQPQAALFDGHGYAHPRRLGLASHLGLWLQLPSVGVAKSRFIGDFEEPGIDKWSQSPLLEGSEQVGMVVRSRRKVKPVFISAGHCIDLNSSLELVKRSVGRYRLPDPLRAAHMLSNQFRKGEV